MNIVETLVRKMAGLWGHLSDLETEKRETEDDIRDVMTQRYKESGEFPSCNPPCPHCGAEESLEYVEDVVEYLIPAYTPGVGVSSGLHIEYGDTKFHHISCASCETYWDSTTAFNEAMEKFLKDNPDKYKVGE